MATMVATTRCGRCTTDGQLLLCRHKFFNTNNLWLNLDKLKALLESSGGVLKLPLIKNKKTVDPRDSSTPAVSRHPP